MIAFVYYTEIYSVTKCLCHVMLWLKELELKIKLGRIYLKNMFRKKIKKIKEFVISPHEWGGDCARHCCVDPCGFSGHTSSYCWDADCYLHFGPFGIELEFCLCGF